MKPRLRAVEVGRIVVSVLGEKEGLEILASCLGSPIRRNSVLERLSISKLVHTDVWVLRGLSQL